MNCTFFSATRILSRYSTVKIETVKISIPRNSRNVPWEIPGKVAMEKVISEVTIKAWIVKAKILPPVVSVSFIISERVSLVIKAGVVWGWGESVYRSLQEGFA